MGTNKLDSCRAEVGIKKENKEEDINIAPIRVTWNRIYLVMFSLALYLLLTYMEFL